MLEWLRSRSSKPKEIREGSGYAVPVELKALRGVESGKETNGVEAC